MRSSFRHGFSTSPSSRQVAEKVGAQGRRGFRPVVERAALGLSTTGLPRRLPNPTWRCECHRASREAGRHPTRRRSSATGVAARFPGPWHRTGPTTRSTTFGARIPGVDVGRNASANVTPRALAQRISPSRRRHGGAEAVFISRYQRLRFSWMPHTFEPPRPGPDSPTCMASHVAGPSNTDRCRRRPRTSTRR